MSSVVAFVPDLMDRSRLGAAVTVVRDLGDARAAAAELLLVDLAREGVLDRLPSGPRIVGFAPHVDEELLAAASDRGCEALPRSVFFKRLPELLAGHRSPEAG